MKNKNNVMEKSVTLRELANYASAALYQSYCEGSAVSDFDPGALKWGKMEEAAQIVIADFFFGGDRRAAEEYIQQHGESEELNMFIGDPDDVNGHPEIYDEISAYNMSIRHPEDFDIYCDIEPEVAIPFD